MNKAKLGFWQVLAIVLGSQISSGVFILPTTLAPFGWYAFIGWLVAGCGAIVLALMFSELCKRFPETGGPHIYVQKVFGNLPAFFTGWTYWLISWVSSTVVFAACIGYLRPIMGIDSPLIYFLLQVLLLAAITALNLCSTHLVGSAEFFFTVLKCIPLVALPTLTLKAFNASNVMLAPAHAHHSLYHLISAAVLITFWGFIGLETATAPAGNVHNPTKTIPLALTVGTTFVALLYLFNSIGIMGAVPGTLLATSDAPYVTAAQLVFSGNWHIAIALISSIVCLSTLNAWTLTTGQIAFGLAQAGLFPKLFLRETKTGAPLWGILVSSIGIVPILALLCSKSVHEQVAAIIDISVVCFLLVYAACAAALLMRSRREQKKSLYSSAVAAGSLLFCTWIISQAAWSALGLAILFIASGIPFYIGWHRSAYHTP